MNKFKETKNDGWVKIYSTDYDENGDFYYVVEYGKSELPAHSRNEYANKSDAMNDYHNAK